MAKGRHDPLAAACEAARLEVVRNGARVAAWSAVVLAPAFALLDAVVFPEHAARFLAWRAGALLVAAAVLVLLRRVARSTHALVLGVLLPVTLGLGLNATIAIAGREASPYLVGLVVVLLGASVLLPWPPSWALAAASLVVAGYPLGIVAAGSVADPRLLGTNTILLGAVAALVTLGAAVSEHLRCRELRSRLALDAHARRQEGIATLGQLALDAVDSRALLARATALVAETLHVPLCEVLELQEDGEQLVSRAGTGWGPGIVGHATARVEGSLAGRALESREPVAFDEAGGGSALASATLLAEHGVRSGVIVVVPGRDRPFGTLGVYDTSARAFEPCEVELVAQVAAVLATAIARESAERARSEEQQTSTALARVGRELISLLETPVLLDRLCELTAEVLGCASSTTWLRQEDGEVYVPISGHGLSAERWEALRSLRVPVPSMAPIVTALEAREVLEVAGDGSEYPLFSGMLAHFGITDSLIVALHRRGEIIGIQVSGLAQPRQSAPEQLRQPSAPEQLRQPSASEQGRQPFAPEQRRIARGIGQLASMALTNARLVEEIEQASRLKSEFVSTMSHELRTPLNVIIGYTDILGEDLASQEQVSLLQHVRSSSLELLEMIEATLDLNRMAAGRDVPHLEPVTVRVLLEELRGEFAVVRRKPGVELRWEAPDDVVLWTDRRKLRIIIKNLVGNALKFTTTGEIGVRCQPENGALAFTVRDTGIGIPADHLPHIFEMFRQVDGSDARSFGGAGLGLYIVRRLLDQLGGDIRVESTPGRGSSFRFTLPLTREVVPQAEEPVAARDAAAGRPAVTTEARALPELPETVAETVVKTLAAGGTLAVSRGQGGSDAGPVGGEAVAPEGSADPGSFGRESRARRIRILVADDLSLSLMLLARFLRREFPGVEVLEAIDGLQALAMVDAYRPDLVLLDLRMPKMDGWQTARRIRALEAGREIPIIALSVNASPTAEMHALGSGCNEFLPKPVSDYGTLTVRVAHWLTWRQAQGARPSAAGAPAVCVLCRQPVAKVQPRGRDLSPETAVAAAARRAV